MQVDSAPPVAPYTILRIKRKRNEEPLDALVVETRRKKSRGGAGVFQYAQTVEPTSWDTGAQQRDIQEHISRLARAPPTAPPSQNPLPASSSRPAVDEISRRYTIVEHDAPRQSIKSRFPTEPPKVVSAKELEKARSTDFKMFEAIPEKPKVRTEVISEMDKFLPMLNEYLKIHDMDVGSKGNSVKASPMIGTPTTDGGVSDDDYVYDVFYHRPQTLAQWNSAANVATVTGLPPQYNDEYDTPSDSEEEADEADEDSNAEEYYKNDYPDEASNSDEWHEGNDDFYDNDDDF